MIVAAYPCTGKSTLSARRWERCIDLETSNFDKHNPDWADYYADVAIDLYNQAGRNSERHIFVSTHPAVINSLNDGRSDFMLLFPSLSLKDVMVMRAEQRLNLSKVKLDRCKSSISYILDVMAGKEEDPKGPLRYVSVDKLPEYEKKEKDLNIELGKNERSLARIRDHYEEDINSLMQYNCNKFIFSDPCFYLEKLFGNN